MVVQYLKESSVLYRIIHDNSVRCRAVVVNAIQFLCTKESRAIFRIIRETPRLSPTTDYSSVVVNKMGLSGLAKRCLHRIREEGDVDCLRKEGCNWLERRFQIRKKLAPV